MVVLNLHPLVVLEVLELHELLELEVLEVQELLEGLELGARHDEAGVGESQVAGGWGGE